MMRTTFFFITLMVGTLATPAFPVFLSKNRAEVAETSDERIVTGQIVEAIENLSRRIRDAGLDPYIRNEAVSFALPVPVLLSAEAIVDNFVFTGLSNIVIERINFSIIQNRLTFSLVIPQLAISTDNISAEASFFGRERAASLNGRININQVRLVGDVRIYVGIISGINIRSLSLVFSLGGIQSNLNLVFFGENVSAKLNTFLGRTVPTAIAAYGSEINELLEYVILNLLNDLLNNRFSFFF